MQKFVRPQELINYKIKKVINLSRFAMPILALAIKINTWSQLQLELSFWGLIPRTMDTAEQDEGTRAR